LIVLIIIIINSIIFLAFNELGIIFLTGAQRNEGGYWISYCAERSYLPGTEVSKAYCSFIDRASEVSASTR